MVEDKTNYDLIQINGCYVSLPEMLTGHFWHMYQLVRICQCFQKPLQIIIFILISHRYV